eukprot:TRINITY_DN2671_c0_g1_i2.p1 TRINITY_DN2671_c0_g1~~TRINITY_DN2671_c0_g1_i2.p1  ORF type:complete len:181 (+),score=25.09 TRINITY_DN2671_c0_g1_i2:121-663(+)
MALSCRAAVTVAALGSILRVHVIAASVLADQNGRAASPVDDPPSDTSDYMDRYIKSASEGARGAWWSGAQSAGNDAGSNSRLRGGSPAPMFALSNPTSDQSASSEPIRGAVVDIRLSSELQMAHAGDVARNKQRSAPGVDDIVSQDRMDDVSIHDVFAGYVNEDVRVENSLLADPNLIQP